MRLASVGPQTTGKNIGGIVPPGDENSSFLSSYLYALPVPNNWHAKRIVQALPFPNADFAEVTELSHVVNAPSRGAISNTTNQSGRITRSDFGEEAEFLEDGHGRGGVEDNSSGAKRA
jgi:hypothetical protein